MVSKWCPNVFGGWSAVQRFVRSAIFRFVLTLEPHQSQYLASLLFIRLHMMQDNILPSADGTEGALLPTHTSCSNNTNAQHTQVYIHREIKYQQNNQLKRSATVIQSCVQVLLAADDCHRSDSWRCELDSHFHSKHTPHDPKQQSHTMNTVASYC